MDKGAHFLRADFQIHSPRDLNWHGEHRVSAEERIEYASGFVQACRAAGLGAIAITDHHDICFVRYIQLAAQGDLADPQDLDTAPLRPFSQNPVVFPGVELTLSMGCQAIVLLDPSCGREEQEALLTLLCGVVHPCQEASGPEVRLLDFETMDALDERLRGHPNLDGRYIILPNVNDRGNDTCLRDRFYQKYARMRCVGGYVDRSLDGHRKLHILDGSVLEWGNKALGLFQTSDHRGDPANPVGSSSTWVKVAVPTTEALRQACLARQSRIKQAEPKLPTVYISRLQVSDSKFMRAVDVELNPQFNAIIGGRGTGKSTILEYLRFAMQDQPSPGAEEDADFYGPVATKRTDLVQRTLRDVRGVVTVHWMVNGVPHVVVCHSSTDELSLRVADGAPEPVSPAELRRLLRIQAYSQKQLSTVGTRTEELRRLVEQPIRDQLDAAEVSIEEKRRHMRSLYDAVTGLAALERERDSNEVQIRSLDAQAKALRASLPQLSKELTTAPHEHPLRLRERQAVEAVDEDLVAADEGLQKADAALTALPRPLDLHEDSPQRQLVVDIHADVAGLVRDMRKRIEDARAGLREGVQRVRESMGEWRAAHEDHEKLYADAEHEARQHSEKLEGIKALRTQEATLQKRNTDLEAEIAKLKNARAEFEEAWGSWTAAHTRQADLLEEQCRALTEKSDGEIQAELARGADFQRCVEELKGALAGCRIGDRWETLSEHLASGDTPQLWMQLMEQVRSLAEMVPDDASPDGEPPKLDAWNLTTKMRLGIVERLTPQAWLQVALVSLRDEPRFSYRDRAGQLMPFRQASAGQQATALMKVLLKESSGPLIVDQPEDDLDNRVIQEIAQAIWAAKEVRQIIFASHNANLVVNGDAELVLHCDYVASGDRSSGTIAHEGAIDVPQVRDAITRVMEGGEEAFQLRRDKYGF